MISNDLFDSAAFDAELLASDHILKTYKAALASGKQYLADQFTSGVSAADLVCLHSELVDVLVIRIWQRFFPHDDQGIALVAVGGYGRGELHPGSDIDLLILLQNAEHQAFKSAIEQFLMFLWDMGLEVGHSVRTTDECLSEALQDVTVATNLMESRLLIGSDPLYRQMCDGTGPTSIWNSKAFFAAKSNEQQARHQKFHDTAYNLEPNVKEGPGGMRDIQMIGWVVKRHFNADTLHELLDHHFLTEHEYQALIEGQNFLWDVRYALHLQAGRREDRLLFEYQKTLAEQFGYVDDEHYLAVEKFMQNYYRTITELSRLNEMLLQLFQEAILYNGEEGITCIPINSRFHSCMDFIEVTDDTIFKRYPFAMLELFLILTQRPELKGVRASTIRLLRDNTHLINEKFRDDLRCQSLFMEILRQPSGITRQFRRMNRYGILAAYLPVFGEIVGRMQYDLFHVYTVDDHTLMVLRNVRRFTVEQFSDEFPFCSQIIQRIPKLELLYLAALFHDVAKGRGGDHSTLGAVDAEEFCVKHSLSNYDTSLVKWLVSHHLLMSVTAQRKDISDPDVIAEFSAVVRDQSRLDHLYLLTVADIRGTNPSLWNNWKDTLLIQLYSATKKALHRGLENFPQKDELIQQTRLETMLLLEKDKGLNPRKINAFWDRLDGHYFLRHDAHEIAWQTQVVLAQEKKSLPLVAFREETRRGGTEVFIFSKDQEHLFAIITAILDQMHLNIADARINTSRDGFTLNTFIVLNDDGHAINDNHRLQEISQALVEGVNDQDLGVLKRMRRAKRKFKHFSTPTTVTFDNNVHADFTTMELVSSDQPGLLAKIAKIMSQCDIKLHSAKISTFGERVEDVFFISDKKDRPIADQEQLNRLETNIIQMIDENS